MSLLGGQLRVPDSTDCRHSAAGISVGAEPPVGAQLPHPRRPTRHEPDRFAHRRSGRMSYRMRYAAGYACRWAD